VGDTADVPAGFCGGCRYAVSVGSRRGSRFLLCERSRLEPRYPKYPRLRVLRCAGFRPRSAEPTTGEARRAPAADAEPGV